jgi:hypothetical protein
MYPDYKEQLVNAVREIITVCPKNHTRPLNTLCGQNTELLTVKEVVHIATTGL